MGKNGTSGECERPETETVSNRRGVFGTWTQWSISWADGWLTVNQYFKQLQRRNTRAGALGELPQNRKTCSTNKRISVSSLILLGHSIIHRDFYIHSKFDSGCIIFMVCKYKEWILEKSEMKHARSKKRVMMHKTAATLLSINQLTTNTYLSISFPNTVTEIWLYVMNITPWTGC